MSGAIPDQAWVRLETAPTTDRDAVRRAYARVLKRIDPERDPDAFGALRDALDQVMAGLADTARTDAALEPDVAAFVTELRGLRRRGDIPGAIARVDRLFAESLAGAALPEAIGLALFQDMALELPLSPVLFRHIADRFDWRDVAGPASRLDPQWYAMVMDRIAAEDWFAGLAAAASSGDIVAATALAPGAPAVPMLSDSEKDRARTVLERLYHWDELFVGRVDARAAAALREGVEGPPLVVTAPTQPIRTKRDIRMPMLGLGAATAAGVWIVSQILPGTPATQIRPQSILRQVQDRWVELRPFDGHTLVYFTTLLSWKKGLRSIRYGLDRPVPDREFPLDGTGPDHLPYLREPPGLHSVSVSVVYADGSESGVRIFRVDPDNAD